MEPHVPDFYERMSVPPIRPEEELIPEPPHAPSAAEVLHQLREEERAVRGEPEPEEEPRSGAWLELGKGRFSLAQMLFVVTVVSVLLGLVRMFPVASAAGVMAALVLLGTVWLSLAAQPPAWAWLAWGVTLAMYLLWAAVAMLGG